MQRNRVKLDKEHRYERVPNSVKTGHESNVTILWNQGVTTDTIVLNKPDIIIRGNENGTCLLMGIVVTGHGGVIKKEAKRIIKYKDITTEIPRVWNVKTSMLPVIIVATGTISKPFRKYLNNIAGRQDSKKLGETAIQGTVHIPEKVLM
jgi:hypothetical protein